VKKVLLVLILIAGFSFAQQGDREFRLEWKNNNSELWQVWDTGNEIQLLKELDPSKGESYLEAAVFTFATPSIYACKGKSAIRLYLRTGRPLKALELFAYLRDKKISVRWYATQGLVGQTYWYLVPSKELNTTDWRGRPVIIKSC
jgi:hypothetical protein